MYAGINLVLSSFFVLLPLTVIDLFDGDEYRLALTLGANQVGTVGMALILSGKTVFKRNTTGIFVGIFAGILGIFVVGLASIIGYVPLLYVGSFITGLGIPVANVHSMTIWQTKVPLDLQGRVFSVRMLTSQIVSPISLLLAGFVAAIIGITSIIIATSLFGFALLFYSWFFTELPYVEEAIRVEKVEAKKTSDMPQESLGTIAT